MIVFAGIAASLCLALVVRYVRKVRCEYCGPYPYPDILMITLECWPGASNAEYRNHFETMMKRIHKEIIIPQVARVSY